MDHHSHLFYPLIYSPTFLFVLPIPRSTFSIPTYLLFMHVFQISHHPRSPTLSPVRSRTVPIAFNTLRPTPFTYPTFSPPLPVFRSCVWYLIRLSPLLSFLSLFLLSFFLLFLHLLHINPSIHSTHPFNPIDWSLSHRFSLSRSLALVILFFGRSRITI